MGRKANKRKRDAERVKQLKYLAEAADTGKSNYGARAGQVIRGNLARAATGQFANALDAIKSGKPLAQDIGINTEQLQGMLALSMGKDYDDGDVLDQLTALGMLGDDGRLNANGRAIISAVKKNDLRLAKQLVDKYAKKPKAKAEPKGKAQEQPKPKKIDAKSEAAALAKDSGTDVKRLNNLLDLSGGASLDAEAMGVLQQWGAVTIKDGKPVLTAVGKSLADGLKAGDRKGARSAIDSLNKSSKAKETDSEPDVVTEKYKLTGKCVHKISGGRKKCFPSRQKAEGYFKALMANVPDAVAELEELMEYDSIELWEATKTIDGVNHPVGDFLAVEDPEKPSTWHLPYKKNGKPDRALAGAAWAALFSAGGFRGQKYQGPDKAKAQAKLKALYKSEEWPMPNEASEAAETDGVGEMYGMDHNAPMYIPIGVTSFADLKAAMSAKRAVDEIREYAALLPMMVDNILSNQEIDDKTGAVKALAAEFTEMVAAAMGHMGSPDTEPDMDESAQDDINTAEDTGEAIAYMEPADLTESDAERYAAVIESGKPTHAYVDIVAIQPGWGNKRDNHYYPAEVVASEDTRKLFVGAKMYESEHNPADKNNRTWVSTVVEAVGVHKSGAPIYRVAVHDPYFAIKAQNLNKMGLLNMLECSIQGEGKAVPGFTEGARTGKRLDSFIRITNIDWVTKAGAGGHAVGLVNESDTGGTMEGQTQATPTAQSQTVTPAAAPVAENVAVNEQNQAPQTAPQAQAPKFLEAAEVNKILEASHLAEISRTRLAERQYSDADAVKTAIQAEIDYLKEATGSGKPVGGFSQRTPQQTEVLAEVSAAKDKIADGFLGVQGR